MYVVELKNQAKMSTAALSGIEKLPEVEYIEAVKTTRHFLPTFNHRINGL
ncbi:hypothetical protein KEH51_29505 [[Brevibacterium] frigoritolerans]|uniref:Uncharacterized protein n=1 Tax=Peribacillus frigoritolerans TaxID=450367 RepID=A0A941J863_9BACI|nr:hypothetical protein [Peribacillus frigoritolerans]